MIYDTSFKNKDWTKQNLKFSIFEIKKFSLIQNSHFKWYFKVYVINQFHKLIVA